MTVSYNDTLEQAALHLIHTISDYYEGEYRGNLYHAILDMRIAIADTERLSLPKNPTPEMVLNGARSIGNTIGVENHNERARLCFNSMIKSLDGYIEPMPIIKKEM